MKQNEKTVTLEDAKEQVRRVCIRLGLLHISFAKTIIAEMGEVKGKEIILKAIMDYGTRIGGEEDLPAYGMNDYIEEVEVDSEKGYRVYGCVMAKLWKEIGEDSLGRFYCYVDPAKYMAYNPHFKLIHTKTAPDGDGYCELVVKPTTKQEREDFADRDSDWFYVDK